MPHRPSLFVAFVALAACARSPIDGDGGVLEEPATMEAGVEDAKVVDTGRTEPTQDAAPQARPDASMQVRDAAVPDAAPARDASALVDARVADASAYDANTSGPADASAAVPDANAPMTCDLTPCQNSCPLATPCCSAAGTCACQLGGGLCILPPIGLN